MTESDPDGRIDGERSQPSGQQPPTVDASTWFREHREVIIVHKGAHYRLRLTQSGKLILTK